MKISFISAALLAAVTAAEDPLMTKLNDLKNAFSQLAESERPAPTRTSQNLAQVESLAEVEVIAEVISQVDLVAEADIEAECSAEAEVDAEAEGNYSDDSDDRNTIINVFNGEAENRRRPWQVNREVCVPMSG